MRVLKPGELLNLGDPEPENKPSALIPAGDATAYFVDEAAFVAVPSIDARPINSRLTVALAHALKRPSLRSQLAAHLPGYVEVITEPYDPERPTRKTRRALKAAAKRATKD